MADSLMLFNAQRVFTAVSAIGNTVFLSSSSVMQSQVNVDGPAEMYGLTKMIFGSTGAPAGLRRSLADAGSAALLQAEYVRVRQRAIGASALLQTALPGVNVLAISATPAGTSVKTRNRLCM